MTDFCEPDDDDVTLTYDSKKNETKKAILFKMNGEKVWIPKSQIVEVDETSKAVVVSAWIAGEKGLG